MNLLAIIIWEIIILTLIIIGLRLTTKKHKHHSSFKNGLQKIWSSAKGMLVMISLCICTFLAITNKMSPSFAAAIGSLVSVMLVVHSKNDRTSMNTPSNPILSNPNGNSTPGIMGNPPITEMLVEENKNLNNKDTP